MQWRAFSRYGVLTRKSQRGTFIYSCGRSIRFLHPHWNNFDNQLPKRLAYFSVMGIQLKILLKPLEHHSTVAQGDLMRPFNWTPIMPGDLCLWAVVIILFSLNWYCLSSPVSQHQVDRLWLPQTYSRTAGNKNSFRNTVDVHRELLTSNKNSFRNTADVYR